MGPDVPRRPYRGQIANLVGAAPKTVAYHLAIARAADPELHDAHESAAALKTSHGESAQGLERMRQLMAMVQERGRYPSRTAESTAERTLAAWLQRRREDARAGTLAPACRDGLAVLPGWQTPPRTDADEARWHDRLEALVVYRDAGNDWPRHKVTVAGLEHDLGVWLHSQRAKLHRGELDGAKEQALDEALPGWQAGRQRGRKPRENGAAASISLGKP
ncbi:helicase associated domain-containing protein [Arthrobacter sp. ISL-65]|uniref:helicase associated domain-containing protein n=1 Tax=Arthrobacter sp. ISL-65 TaxID=2819112 RepID=UPI002035F84D|nr:helicase associated domain-containing protein [Arthrobacter sp. ISL-65]